MFCVVVIFGYENEIIDWCIGEEGFCVEYVGCLLLCLGVEIKYIDWLKCFLSGRVLFFNYDEFFFYGCEFIEERKF